MKITGNKILITGRASGIGLEITEHFVKEGNTVIICGRREAVLKEVVKNTPRSSPKFAMWRSPAKEKICITG